MEARSQRATLELLVNRTGVVGIPRAGAPTQVVGEAARQVEQQTEAPMTTVSPPLRRQGLRGKSCTSSTRVPLVAPMSVRRHSPSTSASRQ
ncbi:MAG TPA: hypothetical protein VF524_15230 [Polyangia bacterium]